MYEIGSDCWPGMAKVVEEAGELLQVMAKIMSGEGDIAYWDGTDLGERLREELADLEAALEFFKVVNNEQLFLTGMIYETYRRRFNYKMDKFMEWHEKQKEERQEDEAKFKQLRELVHGATGRVEGMILVHNDSGKWIEVTLGPDGVEEVRETEGEVKEDG